MISPSTVRIGLLKMQGDTLVTTVGLSANPRVIGGSRPDASVPPMPAPQDKTSRPPELHLLTEGRLPYDVGSNILTRELRGTVIKVATSGSSWTACTSSAWATGGSRWASIVHGSVRGILWAVGHPAYDTATAQLYMPDLVYDGGTRDLMTGALAWLAQGQIEEFLRTKVRIKLGGVLADGQDLLEHALNRDLADGVHLSMDVRVGRVLNVRASPSALLVRAIASGQGELVLDLKPEQMVGQESLGAAIR